MTLLRRAMDLLDRPRLTADLAIMVVGALLCLGLTGYFQVHVSSPANLGGDHLFILTLAKSFINGHGFRFDSQLGYPGARDWLYYPNFDYSYRLGVWIAAHLSHSPFRVVHAVYIASILAMFGFSYWTLRRLGVRAWLAVIGGFASVLTPFLAFRAYAHDALALYFSVPLGVGLALAIGAADFDLRRFFRDPYTIVAVLVVGTSGLYYAFYTCMLATFLAAAVGVARRQWQPMAASIGVSAAILFLLIFCAYGFDLPAALSGAYSGPHRLAFEQLIYGLDLATAGFQFQIVPKVVVGMAQAQASVPEAFVTEAPGGEWPALPLTALMLASPLIVAIGLGAKQQATSSARQATLNQWLMLSAVSIVFAILFGTRGGLGFLFNMLVTPEIRANARLMPVLTFATVVMACMLAELGRTAGNRLVRLAAPALVTLLLLVSVRPYVNCLRNSQRNGLAQEATQQPLRTMPLMIAAKDKAGLKTVLQLPLATWPETPPVNRFEPYRHQIAYLFDDVHGPTRWSYGATSNQPGEGLALFRLVNATDLIGAARAYGFDSALVEKAGYTPEALTALQGTMQKAACRIYEDDVRLLYALNAPC